MAGAASRSDITGGRVVYPVTEEATVCEVPGFGVFTASSADGGSLRFTATGTIEIGKTVLNPGDMRVLRNNMDTYSSGMMLLLQTMWNGTSIATYELETGLGVNDQPRILLQVVAE